MSEYKNTLRWVEPFGGWSKDTEDTGLCNRIFHWEVAYDISKNNNFDYQIILEEKYWPEFKLIDLPKTKFVDDSIKTSGACEYPTTAFAMICNNNGDDASTILTTADCQDIDSTMKQWSSQSWCENATAANDNVFSSLVLSPKSEHQQPRSPYLRIN